MPWIASEYQERLQRVLGPLGRDGLKAYPELEPKCSWDALTAPSRHAFVASAIARGAIGDSRVTAAGFLVMERRRFRYWTGQSGRDYVWSSRGIGLSSRASMSSNLSATSKACITFS